METFLALIGVCGLVGVAGGALDEKETVAFFFVTVVAWIAVAVL